MAEDIKKLKIIGYKQWFESAITTTGLDGKVIGTEMKPVRDILEDKLVGFNFSEPIYSVSKNKKKA